MLSYYSILLQNWSFGCHAVYIVVVIIMAVEGGGGLGWVEVWNGHLHPNKSDAFPVAFPGVVITAWSSLLVSQARGRLHNYLWPLQSYCAGSWESSLHPCYHIIIIIIIDNIVLLSSLQGWCTIIEKDIMAKAITALNWKFQSLFPLQIVTFPREKETGTQLDSVTNLDSV